ncbi:hypothetical protein BH09GEM1_BH09GEM1_32350 [soil metagenome]
MGTNVKSAARVMDASRRLVRALAGSARAIEAGTGISGAQLFILRQLAGAEQPLSVSELADLTLTHQSTVSGVVSRLVERGLVTRTPASDDARRVEVAITRAGRRLLADAPLTVQTQLVSGLARLGEARRDILANVLDAWLDASGLAGEPAHLFFEHDPDESPPPRTRRRRNEPAR